MCLLYEKICNSGGELMTLHYVLTTTGTPILRDEFQAHGHKDQRAPGVLPEDEPAL